MLEYKDNLGKPIRLNVLRKDISTSRPYPGEKKKVLVFIRCLRQCPEALLKATTQTDFLIP